MNWVEIMDVAQNSAPVLSMGLFLAVLYLGTKFVSHTRCAEHREHIAAEQKKRIAGSDERRVALEAVIAELPSSDDIAALRIAMAELRGDMGALSEGLNGQRALIKRMEGDVSLIKQHLMGAA